MLRMADHSKVHPMGILAGVETMIAGIIYHINYVVFQLKISILSYPILLDRPCLFHAKARNDWGRGTLTIGKRRNKIVLQMYRVPHNGESQIRRTDFTSDNSDTDDEDEETSYGNKFVGSVPSKVKHRGVIYQCGDPGEYLIHQDDIENFDHAILKWMNNYMVNDVSAFGLELDNTNPLDFRTGCEPDKPLQSFADL